MANGTIHNYTQLSFEVRKDHKKKQNKTN
jgi:hypothetical protein